MMTRRKRKVTSTTRENSRRRVDDGWERLVTIVDFVALFVVTRSEVWVILIQSNFYISM